MSTPGSAVRRTVGQLGAETKAVADRLLRVLRIGRRPSERPLPRVRLRMGSWVPGWVLRLGVAAVGLACAALLVRGGFSTFLAIAGAILLVVLPSGIACAAYAAGLGLLLAISTTAPFAPRSFLLLFGVHLLVQLGALASATVWSSQVDLRLVLSSARRFLAGQAFAQPLALAGAALTTAAVSVPWAPVLVGIALTGLAWWVLSRLLSTS